MSYFSELFNLENKVAVLTGGAGVLASEMAGGFLKAGAKVVLLDLKVAQDRWHRAPVPISHSDISPAHDLGVPQLDVAEVTSLEDHIKRARAQRNALGRQYVTSIAQHVVGQHTASPPCISAPI